MLHAIWHYLTVDRFHYSWVEIMLFVLIYELIGSFLDWLMRR